MKGSLLKKPPTKHASAHPKSCRGEGGGGKGKHCRKLTYITSARRREERNGLVRTGDVKGGGELRESGLLVSPQPKATAAESKTMRGGQSIKPLSCRRDASKEGGKDVNVG